MLNASSVMRKRLKLSAAAWTKHSGLIKTRIFCVPPRESRQRSKRSCFQGETNSCSFTLYLPYTSLWTLFCVCVLVSVFWKELLCIKLNILAKYLLYYTSSAFFLTWFHDTLKRLQCERCPF